MYKYDLLEHFEKYLLTNPLRNSVKDCFKSFIRMKILKLKVQLKQIIIVYFLVLYSNLNLFQLNHPLSQNL